MKSAIELAMERSGGKGKEIKLTAEQKGEIAELRRKAKAKIAEEEIMVAKVDDMPDGEEKTAVKEQLARTVRKINEKMEADIENVRQRKH